jgi:hypothetical protein
LSKVLDDLGAQGEPPVNPALLDWLACEFMDSGWDMQHMIRLIVTSHTYQQSSHYQTAALAVDPANRLLASQNPRRLEAEFVRDNALAIAGLLNLEDIGGPSVKPYQPANYYEALQFPNRDYIADTEGALLGSFAILFLMGAAFTAIGCLASALTSSQIIAGIVTITILVIHYFLGFVTVIWGESFAGAGFFHYISSQRHLHYFANGLLDSRAAVYYLSLTTFFLFLTHQVIDLRRWRP